MVGKVLPERFGTILSFLIWTAFTAMINMDKAKVFSLYQKILSYQWLLFVIMSILHLTGLLYISKDMGNSAVLPLPGLLQVLVILVLSITYLSLIFNIFAYIKIQPSWNIPARIYIALYFLIQSALIIWSIYIVCSTKELYYNFLTRITILLLIPPSSITLRFNIYRVCDAIDFGKSVPVMRTIRLAANIFLCFFSGLFLILELTNLKMIKSLSSIFVILYIFFVPWTFFIKIFELLKIKQAAIHDGK